MCGHEWVMVPRAIVLNVQESDLPWCVMSPRSRDMEQVIRTASALLEPEEHDDECPVRHNASADCCWPIAVCVPHDFWDRILFYRQLAGNSA